MKYTITIIILLLSAILLFSEVKIVINELMLDADWAELYCYGTAGEEVSVNIGPLYLGNFSGSSYFELMPSSEGTLTISTYDKADTSWDDRYIVVYISGDFKENPMLYGGENDQTGDINTNGYLETYSYGSMTSDGDDYLALADKLQTDDELTA